MDWFPLALICALSLASADALSKRHLSDYSGPELVLIRFTLPGLLLAPILVFNPLPPVPPAFWGWIAALVPLELLAMWLYVVAIRDSALSNSLPYLAFTPVLTTVTGLLVLGERVSLQGFTGILLVVTGAYLLNIEHAQRGDLRAWLAPFPAILRERGSRMMLGVATLYSLTSVMAKGALQYVPPEMFGPFYWCILGLSALLVFSAGRPGMVQLLWQRPSWHLAIGGTRYVTAGCFGYAAWSEKKRLMPIRTRSSFERIGARLRGSLSTISWCLRRRFSAMTAFVPPGQGFWRR